MLLHVIYSRPQRCAVLFEPKSCELPKAWCSTLFTFDCSFCLSMVLHMLNLAQRLCDSLDELCHNEMSLGMMPHLSI